MLVDYDVISPTKVNKNMSLNVLVDSSNCGEPFTGVYENMSLNLLFDNDVVTAKTLNQL